MVHDGVGTDNVPPLLAKHMPHITFGRNELKFIPFSYFRCTRGTDIIRVLGGYTEQAVTCGDKMCT